MIGQRWLPLPVPCPIMRDREFQQIAELEYANVPSTPVDGKITENRSAIPLFTIIYTLKV
jgi:hypothetical protein